jgi:hypothetical protein
MLLEVNTLYKAVTSFEIVALVALFVLDDKCLNFGILIRPSLKRQMLWNGILYIVQISIWKCQP